MGPFWRRLLIVTILGVAVFAVFSIYADVAKLGDRFLKFAPSAVAFALVLASGNYAVRFVRWHLYLRRVAVQVPLGTSLLVFVAGFAMSVTPGKLGELVKAVLLKETSGADPARVAPVVVAERATDLLALVILGVLGVATYGVAREMVVVAAAVTAVAIFLLAWRPAAHATIGLIGKIPKLGRLAPKLLNSYDHMEQLVRPWPLTWATALATLAWLCECVGFALIVNGFPGAHVDLGLATLIYAATTVAGALSFLPGGLLVTEASMTLMLVASAQGLDRPAAVAATILTRLCTLWFAVVLGLVCLLLLRRVKPSAAALLE